MPNVQLHLINDAIIWAGKFGLIWLNLRNLRPKVALGRGASGIKKPAGRQAFPFSATLPSARDHEHPVVDPQVSHFMQVPFLTKVKLPHSEHISPS